MYVVQRVDFCMETTSWLLKYFHADVELVSEVVLMLNGFPNNAARLKIPALHKKRTNAQGVSNSS